MHLLLALFDGPLLLLHCLLVTQTQYLRRDVKICGSGGEKNITRAEEENF